MSPVIIFFIHRHMMNQFFILNIYFCRQLVCLYDPLESLSRTYGCQSQGLPRFRSHDHAQCDGLSVAVFPV